MSDTVDPEHSNKAHTMSRLRPVYAFGNAYYIIQQDNHR